LVFFSPTPNHEVLSRTSLQKREYSASLNSYDNKYLDFAHTPSKTFFQKFVVGTNLRKALVKMSEDKALPKGLCKEEVERGKIKRPRVPYIPPVDPIGDAVESNSGTNNFKVSLTDGTIVYHAV